MLNPTCKDLGSGAIPRKDVSGFLRSKNHGVKVLVYMTDASGS